MVVSLKGGAPSGAEALRYMKSSEGYPNQLLSPIRLSTGLPPWFAEDSVQLAAKLTARCRWSALRTIRAGGIMPAGPKTVKEFNFAARKGQLFAGPKMAVPGLEARGPRPHPCS